MGKTIIILVAFLSVISLAVYFLIKKFPKKDFSELGARVKLWWGMVFIFTLSSFLSSNISVISLAFLCFFSLKEFFSLIPTRKNDRRIFIWAYLSIPIQFYWIYTDWYGMFVIFIPIYVFLFLPFMRILAGGAKGFLKSVSSTHWGIMLMVFGLSHLAYYGIMNPTYGPKLVLYLVALTQFSDVVQYMVSKTIGKKHLFQNANSNLTVEGLFSSIVLTIGASILLAPVLTPLSTVWAVWAGLLISVTGFFGIMNVSFVKRDLQLDENGKFIPHKESVLNRIDSLSYTAPLFLHFLRYFFDWI